MLTIILDRYHQPSILKKYFQHKPPHLFTFDIEILTWKDGSVSSPLPINTFFLLFFGRISIIIVLIWLFEVYFGKLLTFWLMCIRKSWWEIDNIKKSKLQMNFRLCTMAFHVISPGLFLDNYQIIFTIFHIIPIFCNIKTFASIHHNSCK